MYQENMNEIKKLPLSGDLLTMASGPVIIENEKVLLVQHGEDIFWKFPGGTLRLEESVLDACSREAFEELGVTIHVEKEAPFLFYVEQIKKEVRHRIILFHFLAHCSSQDWILGDDIRSCEWFPVHELPSELAPNILPALEYFMKKKG